MNKQCLNCKWFKMDDIDLGICRKEKGQDAPRPKVKAADVCSDWFDAGQQYHIRMGWIKSQKKKR